MSRKFVLKPDKEDLRDITFRATAVVSTKQLPQEIDLRPQMSPIVDQGQLGSCTANAIASGLGEFLQIKKGKPVTRLSRLFLYWFERYLEGTVEEDSGAYIRDGFKVLQKIGCTPEALVPYVEGEFTKQPEPSTLFPASDFRIKEYHRITNYRALKTALAEGSPVVLGIYVYDSFMNVGADGIVPVPDTQLEQMYGGHAIIAVGYKTINGKEYIIIRNSWGETWGDKGYCYIPTEYWTNKCVMDMWTGK